MAGKWGRGLGLTRETTFRLEPHLVVVRTGMGPLAPL